MRHIKAKAEGLLITDKIQLKVVFVKGEVYLWDSVNKDLVTESRGKSTSDLRALLKCEASQEMLASPEVLHRGANALPRHFPSVQASLSLIHRGSRRVVPREGLLVRAATKLWHVVHGEHQAPGPDTVRRKQQPGGRGGLHSAPKQPLNRWHLDPESQVFTVEGTASLEWISKTHR